MTTRELIKNEVDQLQEHYLLFLHRIIRALKPTPSTKSMPNLEQSESWEEFLENTYGMFQDDPLERGPQGTLEIREAIE